MARMIFGVIAALAVSCVAAFGQTSRPSASPATKPDLGWMFGYTHNASWYVVEDPRFPIDVRAYLPRIRLHIPGESGMPEQMAGNNLQIPQAVYVQDGFIVASGCHVHECNVDAVLVLANPISKPPSLTLAFADAGSLTQMWLYVYSSEPASILSDPNVLAIFRNWLEANLVGHIDKMLFAGRRGFSAVPTPELLRHVPGLEQRK